MTLFEVVLYIALFAALIGGATLSVFQMVESSARSEAKVLLEYESGFILKKIFWVLRGASLINTPYGATSTTLSINSSMSLDNPVIFEVTDGALTIRTLHGERVTLNTSDVRVSGIEFFHTDSSTTHSESVVVNITLETMSTDGSVLRQKFKETYYATP